MKTLILCMKHSFLVSLVLKSVLIFQTLASLGLFRFAVPSDPPKNVVIQAVNSTSIMFAWAPPDAWSINGINQGYKVSKP